MGNKQRPLFLFLFHSFAARPTGNMSVPSSPQEIALESKWKRIAAVRHAMAEVLLTPDQAAEVGMDRATPEVISWLTIKPTRYVQAVKLVSVWLAK